MVTAICRELELRKMYLGTEEPISTVYFGGGTPSLVPPVLLEKILEAVRGNFRLNLEEVTLEANPDDLRAENLEAWRKLGIDRLSIGVQTFDEQTLRFYNRAHTAEESISAIKLAKAAGFQKLSIDLMYGFPAKDHTGWIADLDLALSQDPGHISSYCLTLESKTALGAWERQGKFLPASDDFAAEQFDILLDRMAESGYIQYEISNFGRPGHFAVHNTRYWQSVPYLGIGPSAHSFDGRSRGANVSSNAQYIKRVKAGELPFTLEDIDRLDIANEYILTSLRTIWGLDTRKLFDLSGWDISLEKEVLLGQLQSEQLVLMESGHIRLTRKGKFVADGIAAALFI